MLVSLGLGGDRGTMGTAGVHNPPLPVCLLIWIICNDDAENITVRALEVLFGH